MLNSKELLYLITCISKKKTVILEKLIAEYNKATENEKNEEITKREEGWKNFKNFIELMTWGTLEAREDKSLFIANAALKQMIETIEEAKWLNYKLNTRNLIDAITKSCNDNGYSAEYPARLTSKPRLWGIRIKKLND